MIKRIINSIKNIKQNITSFKTNKIEGILNIGISLITCTAIINFIYTLISFIINFGFKNEFNAYTWSNYFNIIYLIISIILFIISLIMIYINYYIEEKKKTPFILLIISLIFIGIIYIYFLASYSNMCKEMTDGCKALENILTINGLVTGDNIAYLVLGFGIISLILFIISLIIIGKDGYSDNIFDLIIISIFSFLIVPVILLIISNIIPLGIWLLILVGVYVGFMIFTFIMGSSGSSIGSGGYSSSFKPKKERVSKPIKDDSNIKKFDGNVEFVREYSYNNSTEMIYAKRWNGKNVVCTAKEFDSGKVIIEKNGKKVTNIFSEKK